MIFENFLPKKNIWLCDEKQWHQKFIARSGHRLVRKVTEATGLFF